MRRLLPLLLLLFATVATPVYAQELNPGGGTVVIGTPPNAVFNPGPVSITGNSANGNDQITGIANLNGVRYADQFTGADIGVKANAAIASLGTQGGRIHMPMGHYTFSTTIQCPTGVGAPPIIIEGDAREPEQSTVQLGTWLSYTGSGDAINQVITSPTAQNGSGCQLRDLVLDGAGATGGSPIGYHVGGTEYARTQNVTIQNFAGAGIELENASGMFTERYDFSGMTSINNNGAGIKFVCDPGCNNSFGHGVIDIWTNTNAGQAAILLTNNSGPYDTDWKVNGNIGANGTLLQTTGTANVLLTSFTDNTECMATPCTRFNIGTGTTFGAILNTSQGSAGADIINGTAFLDTSRIYLGFTKHLTYYNWPADVPTATACGSSPSVNTSSTDSWGWVTIGGTGPNTHCTVTFAHSWKTNPFCMAQDASGTGNTMSAAANTTTLNINSSGDMSGHGISWMCAGRAF